MCSPRSFAVVAATCLVSQLWACHPAGQSSPFRPALATQRVAVDPDDPAIWVDPTDASQSLILGTDKGGTLYAFHLDGSIDERRTRSGLGKLNNVDVEYGVDVGGVPTDVAVATDSAHGMLRVFRLPDMIPVDGGGLPVFAGEVGERGQPMGIALYRRPHDGRVFAVVSRKSGPRRGYLWQYLLDGSAGPSLRAVKVRELGLFSGHGEIEAVAVDDALGYIYYSDETAGVRKYHADPDHPEADRELAFFATEGFSEDREGISIYELDETTGYVLVTDQAANQVHVFRREGEPGDPHRHEAIARLKLDTRDSDGCEVTSVPLDARFEGGLFVAMSDDKTFHLYSWAELAAVVPQRPVAAVVDLRLAALLHDLRPLG